jgi:putative transposase
VSEATNYNWRKKYAGRMPSEMKRLKQLEEENAKLKRIVADMALDREKLRDVITRELRGLRGGASWSIGCERQGG